MQIDLAGLSAAITGPQDELHCAIVASLKTSGAVVQAVSSEADIRALARLDVLVNIALDGSEALRIEQLCRAAAERMSGGRILNIISASGAVPIRGEPRASAAAAAIVALTKALALEFGECRILVNALAVGAVAGTPLAKRLISHVPLGRAGSVDEIARAALFLLDPENSYTTGHVMLVDGGWAAGYARNF